MGRLKYPTSGSTEYLEKALPTGVPYGERETSCRPDEA